MTRNVRSDHSRVLSSRSAHNALIPCETIPVEALSKPCRSPSGEEFLYVFKAARKRAARQVTTLPPYAFGSGGRVAAREAHNRPHVGRGQHKEPGRDRQAKASIRRPSIPLT